jgi:hypothetical protein
MEKGSEQTSQGRCDVLEQRREEESERARERESERARERESERARERERRGRCVLYSTSCADRQSSGEQTGKEWGVQFAHYSSGEHKHICTERERERGGKERVRH